MKKIVIVIINMLFGIGAFAQDFFKTPSGKTVSKNDINHLIESQMEKLNMAGLSFGLVENGKIVFKKHFGFSNWEKKEAITDQHIFEAASMSKPVFAWLVMKLCEKGVLNLDEPLYNYYTYPDVSENVEHKAVTARMILTHQTGLPNWRYGRPLAFNFEPGSDFLYSGEGFVWLGKVIEHLMKMPLEKVFQQEVFMPLKMLNSTMVWSPSINMKKASGHYVGNVFSEDYYKPFEANPAASLLTNVDDFSKFMSAVLNYEGLKKESYEDMFRIQVKPQKGNPHQNEEAMINWGLGWVIEETHFGLKYQHGGNNGDFESYFEISPDKKSGYVYFTNSDMGDEINEVLKPFLTTGETKLTASKKLESQYEIPINAALWKIEGRHERLDLEGKEAIAFFEEGEAMLEDSVYQNMIIEFDVAFPKGYCNVGVNFRGKDAENHERFYIRAHESGTGQTMQYTPIFNGQSGWQLYSGYNYNGRTTHLRYDGWMHVKMAIFDDWMEVYIDDLENLALHVFDLKYKPEKGFVSFWCDNTAYFSDFRIREINAYDFYYDYQPKPNPPAGTITNWNISETLSDEQFKKAITNLSALDALNWQVVKCEYNGLVNLSRTNQTTYNKNTVIGRTKIVSDKKQRKSVQFGYSDIGKIYLNGKILYDGQRMFQSRDSDYRGTIGYHQRIFLDLEEGENDLWFVISENFGGWGLMMKFDDAEGVELKSD